MSDNFTNLSRSKISTLILLGVMYTAGGRLVSGNPEIKSLPGAAGAIILGVAVVLSIFSFLEYRYKEQTDNAILHLDKTISSMSKALKNVGKTSQLAEKATQDTLRRPKDGTIGKRSVYTVQESNETETEE